jgi:hypothetical protein
METHNATITHRVYCYLISQVLVDSKTELELLPAPFSNGNVAVQHFYNSASPLTVKFQCSAATDIAPSAATAITPRLTAVKADNLTVQ